MSTITPSRTIIENDSIDLSVVFKDASGVVVPVTGGVATIALDGVSKSSGPLTAPVSPDTFYHYTFFPLGWKPGYYTVKFQGDYDSGKLVVAGSFGLEEQDTIAYYIRKVRSRLKDAETNWKDYKLDAPEAIWTDQEIVNGLGDTLNYINTSAPRPFSYSFESCPIEHLLVLGTTAYCLFNKAVLEASNTFSYSDVLSLNIQRVQYFQQLADKLYSLFYDQLRRYKLSQRPSPIGLGQQRLPFRILRPLGMLPNMANTFGI